MADVNDVVSVANTAINHHDLSFWSLFAQASVTVKLVIILLLGCSFWTWTVIFAKFALLKKIKDQANQFEEMFWRSNSIENLFNRLDNKNTDNPILIVFMAGMKEWSQSKKKTMSAIAGMSLLDRISTMMRVALVREIEYLEKYLGFLATVGSTAPFVGLFGTVWGIMNSFESIGMDQNTSLVSVAPGIAEALFATALGLIVTIPAVIAYNKISSEINRYQSRVESFIDEFLAMISRYMDNSEN